MRKILLFVLLCIAATGCATTQAGPNGIADRDPYEEFNRSIWDANMAADSVVIRPAAEVYSAISPQPVRSGVSNFFRNFAEPWSFVNNLLQGKPDRAIRNVGRFIINSTIGVGGLFDIASEIGIEPAPEDFGQTLAVWGVGDGGYRVLPLLGPSTSRDMVGSIVDFMANPSTIFLDRVAGFSTIELWGLRAGSIVDTRADAIDSGVDSFLESSVDPYAAARSAYFQRREAQILDYDVSGLTDDVDGEAATEGNPLEAAADELEEDGFEGLGDIEPPE